MALKRYRELKPGGRYLRAHGVGANTDVDPHELREAETEAAVWIDTHLCKTFSASAPPPIVRSLAELIGSAIFLEYAAISSDWREGEGFAKAQVLRRAAGDVIADLKAHRLGIQNADATWDSDYPQPTILATADQGDARPITVVPGLKWEQMAQPKMDDDEKDDLDDETRLRHADAVVAAYAGGAYTN